MEITFKVLDRVTVNGLYNKTSTDITSFAYCTEDNTYYLLDDPILLKSRNDIEKTKDGYKITIRDEAKVSIVTCNTLKDVYKQLINRLIRNDLNPFVLYKKYKQGYLTGNEMIDNILSSVNIPDEDIDMMIEEIAKAEKNHPDKRISIDIDILKGMDDAYKLLRENKEIKIKDTIIDLINDITVKAYNSIIYPRGHTLVKMIEELINEEKERLERLLKKQKNINNNSGQMQELEEDEDEDRNKGRTDRQPDKEGTKKKEDEQTPNNNNNNNDDTDSTDSNDTTAGSGPSSPSQYIYTIRLFVPYSLSRAELQDIIYYIRDKYADAKVEII